MRFQVVPTDAAAAALNVTVADPDTAGFISVWPCGRPEPLASNLNYGAGDILVNRVIAPLGANGEFCVCSKVTIDIVADFARWVFLGATPIRVVDTRSGRSTGLFWKSRA